MNCRNSEKVIDIVLLRVLEFYLATILETGTSILLLTRVKNTGRSLIGIPQVFWVWNFVFRRRNLLLHVIHRIRKRITESLYMLYCFEENWYLVNYCSQEKETGGLLFWRELVHYCSQEKETVVLLFWREVRTDSTLLFFGEENCWSTVLKRTSVLLFSGEGNRWSTVLKKIDTLLFFGEENCWSTVLKRTSVLLFSGEGNRWSTVLKRTSAVQLFSGEEN